MAGLRGAKPFECTGTEDKYASRQCGGQAVGSFRQDFCR
jgi:hypothetical protein